MRSRKIHTQSEIIAANFTEFFISVFVIVIKYNHISIHTHTHDYGVIFILMSFLDFSFPLPLNNSGKMNDDKTHFKSKKEPVQIFLL